MLNLSYQTAASSYAKAVRIQQIGWVCGKMGSEFKVGNFMLWNGGSATEVVAIEKETAAFITFRLRYVHDGRNAIENGSEHTRRIGRDRLVAEAKAVAPKVDIAPEIKIGDRIVADVTAPDSSFQRVEGIVTGTRRDFIKIDADRVQSKWSEQMEDHPGTCSMAVKRINCRVVKTAEEIAEAVAHNENLRQTLPFFMDAEDLAAVAAYTLANGIVPGRKYRPGNIAYLGAHKGEDGRLMLVFDGGTRFPINMPWTWGAKFK